MTELKKRDEPVLNEFQEKNADSAFDRIKVRSDATVTPRMLVAAGYAAAVSDAKVLVDALEYVADEANCPDYVAKEALKKWRG